jgi:alkylation response protein AidB-like acyl-CoA dehydrogenase
MALDFNLTDEQKMLEDSVYKWAVAWLEPQMEHMYEVDEMPPTIFKETANLGINGIVFEEKYGGTEMGYVETRPVHDRRRQPDPMLRQLPQKRNGRAENGRPAQVLHR